MQRHCQKTSINKYVIFQWKINLYEFLWLYFGLLSAPKIFLRLMKIPITNTNLEKTLHQDLNLPRQYAFNSSHPIKAFNGSEYFNIYYICWISYLTSVLNPELILELLGLVVNSQYMTSILTKEKILKIQEQCKEILRAPLTAIRTLSKLINRLASTALENLLASLQYRALQHDQIQGMLSKYSLEEKVTLLEQMKYNGKSLITPPAQIIIRSMPLA